MRPEDKQTVIIGAGAGVGVLQTVISKQYDFVLIDAIPSPWNTMASLGNILIGGVLFSITQFTNIIANKNYAVNNFLKIYGMTTLIGGLMNGIFPSPVVMTAKSNYVATLPGGRNGHLATSYYPDYQGVFIERPATRAKGFGSDVTVNPKAAIPTEIPYNVINS